MGAACRATRLAVVHRRRLSARQQRPADVGGAGVLLPQGIHRRLRTGTVGHGLHTADEAAFLDDDFAVRGRSQGL